MRATPAPMPGQRRVSAIAFGVVLLAGYVGVVAWITWPLASVATGFLPVTKGACLCDTPYSAWAMAWASRALADLHVHLADANVYHPAPQTFFYGPAGFGALPYYAPVFLATGNAALATNVTLLGGLALTAWGMHLVVQRWTGSMLAGVVAAAVLLTNNWLTYVFVPTTPHMAALQCFPWILFGASARPGRFARALRLLPLLVLQSLTDLAYVVPAVLGPLGLLVLGRLARRATRADALRLLGVLVLAALVLFPVYRPYLRVRAENPSLARQSVWADVSLQAALPAQLWSPEVPGAVKPVLAVLIVAGAIALALRRGRTGPDVAAWRHGALWTLAGLYLSLSPVVSWNGTAVTLPQAWVSAGSAVYRTLRITNRVGVAALMGLAVLAGVAFAEVTARISLAGRWSWIGVAVRGALAVGVVVGLYRASLVPHMSPMGRPYPVVPAAEPSRAILEQVLRVGGPLVEIPARVDEPEPQAVAMYHSITHRQPILNGYSSYYPTGFPERMETAMRLPDPDALRTLVRDTGLRLVWVHVAAYPSRQRLAWLSVATGAGPPGLTLVAHDGSDLLFAVVADGS